MATPEKKEEAKKVKPLLELAKCSKATPAPDPDEYGPIITIEVGTGPHTRKFYAYKGLLSHYSSYFKAALKDDWKEGTFKTVELKDENPEVFQAFFRWLYTGKLYFALDASGKIPLSEQLICEIYVFGDARGSTDLCNTAIDLLLQKTHQEWKVPLNQIAYVYENTLPGSALRKYLVDDVVETYRFGDLSDLSQRESELSRYPQEFLANIVVAFMALGSTPIPSSAGYGKLPFGQANWGTYIKPLICSKYHDHPTPPA
ncbi:uncharacterized protein J4E88_004087 [Alternaria novae-zelandiae]|uniref:uncharacterized protein n=1 Tax=Alternaria novae-zelandiae TaxID=430562 RepID=UPI0020C25A34|nr:uncharacterized protein J4E88_004087 [Alternaria novae-zelandiae]KAI4684646.1 hypothetical protein J4E88_004087 [Alternaria novae-zelandiae]